jgi:hypothetical protein
MTKPRTPYEIWFDRTEQDDDADCNFTWGEIVWKAAQAAVQKQRRKRHKARKSRAS